MTKKIIIPNKYI